MVYLITYGIQFIPFAFTSRDVAEEYMRFFFDHTDRNFRIVPLELISRGDDE